VKTTEEIRLENLKALRSEFRFQSEIAEKVQKSRAQVHQWLSGVRSIGHKAAREVEVALGKPAGWLDNDHSLPLAETTSSPSAKSPSFSGSLSEQESELLGYFRRCSPESREILLASARAAARLAAPTVRKKGAS